MKKIGILLALLFSSLHFAAGNIEKGMEKSVTCAACHGAKGISTNPIWPNLAGQQQQYLLKQLQDYKQGTQRQNASMTGMVAGLSDDDMLDLASYYASLPVAQSSTPKQYLLRGEQLYRGGDFKAHISACIACHGPNGMGNGQARFPALSGQHAAYSIMQLQQFKAGKRSNDLNGIMRDISQRMSQEDIDAVAYYVQGLH